MSADLILIRELAALESRALAAEAEAKWAKDLAAKWKALSVLQDSLLACYRTGRNPGRVLDQLAAARAALERGTAAAALRRMGGEMPSP